jgi:hypothetical protein
MENPKEDTLCINETFSNNLRIQYEKNQVVLKPLLCTMMKRIKQLEEKVCVMESMGDPCPSRSLTCKPPATVNEGPTYRLKLNFVSPQMGTYGAPPRQPIHNSWLWVSLRSLCKYNYDCKDYANQNKPKTKKNQILVKPTMAMSTSNLTKPTKKMERKPDGNANATLVSTGIKSSEAKPAPLEPFMDKTASSETIYFDASDRKAPSKDILATINALVTASAAAPATAATVVSVETNKTKSVEEAAPPMPPVPKSASSKNLLALPMHLSLYLLLHLLQQQLLYLIRQTKPTVKKNRRQGRHLCQRRHHLTFKTPMLLSPHLLQVQPSNPK